MLSLFSGIGGIDLAAEWAGIETVCFCEIDKYCQKVLTKHWPNVPIIEDAKDVTKERIDRIMADSDINGAKRDKSTDGQGCGIEQGGEEKIMDLTNGSGCLHGQYEIKPAETGEQTLGQSIPGSDYGFPRIDIIAGGFPCQPHSVAGKRKGSTDKRNLWPEFRRVIGEIRPRYVLCENVPGLFTSDGGSFFNGIISDLAQMGYVVGWATYGAVDVGALHRRNRVFIVAHSKHDGGSAAEITHPTSQSEGPSDTEPMADTDRQGLQGRAVLRECGNKRVARQGSVVFNSPIKGLPDWAGGEMEQPSPLTEFERPDGTEKEREIERDFRGVFTRVSRRVDRLKCLGNAVVPQQIYPIFKAIMEIELARKTRSDEALASTCVSAGTASAVSNLAQKEII